MIYKITFFLMTFFHYEINWIEFHFFEAFLWARRSCLKYACASGQNSRVFLPRRSEGTRPIETSITFAYIKLYQRLSWVHSLRARRPKSKRYIELTCFSLLRSLYTKILFFFLFVFRCDYLSSSNPNFSQRIFVKKKFMIKRE